MAYFNNYQTIGKQLFPGQSTPAPSGSIFGASPTSGQGAFGLVPGAINPPAAAGRSINADLSGLVSPEIQQRLQNEAARFGISSGMPGSGLAGNRYLHDYLGAGEAARDRGFKHYGELLPLAERNAELVAAPDPQQRAQTEQSFAQQMFDRYLAATRGSGNTGGGGGGGYQPSAAPVGAPAGARPGSFSSPNAFTSPTGPAPLSGMTPWAGPYGPEAYPPAQYPPIGEPAPMIGAESLTPWTEPAGMDYGAPAGTMTAADSSYYDPYSELGLGWDY